MTDIAPLSHQYKRGLTPFDPEKHARFKTVRDYGFTLPTPQYPIDKTQGITEWGMDGNGPDPTLTVNGGQPVGDCGPSAVPSHSNTLTAVLAGLELSQWTMTSDQVLALYFTYQAIQAGIDWRPTGDGWVAPDGLDVGVDLGDWLLYLFEHDADGNEVAPGEGVIEGFVAIPLEDLDSGLGLFDVVICGVNLNPQADEQFPGTWDIGPGDEPDAADGHAILYAKALSASGPFGWITWGANQLSTLPWKQKCVQQAFAVATAAEAEAKGFLSQYTAIVSDLHALGGTAVNTPPAPAPAPVPDPIPAPPAPVPAPPAPEPTPAGPTPADIEANHLVALTDVKEAVKAERNGWPLEYWADGSFKAQVDHQPENVTLYADQDYETKRDVEPPVDPPVDPAPVDPTPAPAPDLIESWLLKLHGYAKLVVALIEDHLGI